MRAALLSMSEDGAVAGRPAALLGRDVLEWQAAWAVAEECDEVFLFAPLADAGNRVVLSVQKLVETHGARFRILRDTRGLLGCLARDDILLVLAPGVLPLADEARGLRAGGPVLTRIGAEEEKAPQDRPMELLDAHHRWAGLLIVDGALVERLTEAEPEYDTASSLLRLARMSGVREIDVSPSALAAGTWVLPDGSRSDDALFERVAGVAEPTPLERWVLLPAARRLAQSANGFRGALVLAIVTALGTTAGAALGWHITAIALAILSLSAWRLTGIIRRASDPAAWVQGGRMGLDLMQLWPNLVATITLADAFLRGIDLPIAAFLALTPVIVWNLAAFAKAPRIAPFGDREALWGLILIGGALGSWLGGAALAALMAVGGLAKTLRIFPRITGN